jgi:hypothetical protein
MTYLIDLIFRRDRTSRLTSVNGDDNMDSIKAALNASQRWVKFSYTYQDIIDATIEQDQEFLKIKLPDFPAGTIGHGLRHHVKTAFVHETEDHMKFDIHKDNSGATWFPDYPNKSFDFNLNHTSLWFLDERYELSISADSTEMYMQFSLDNAAFISDLTAGQIDIYILMSRTS